MEGRRHLKNRSAKSLKQYVRRTIIILCFCLTLFTCKGFSEGLPLYWWRQDKFTNFGDHLSLVLVERIVNQPVESYRRKPTNNRKKLLAIGSLLYFADQDDVLWGTGHNNKFPDKEDYIFTNLDVRALRGPLTRDFLMDNFGIDCPEIYGDPALLIPYLFPEFKRKLHPSYKFIIIPHYKDQDLFPKSVWNNVVYSTDPWYEVINKILDSEFVISSSLHGIVIAEAWGVPARYIRVSEHEPLFKYTDYYLGTGRPDFHYAQTVQEALELGGEPPFECDLKKLYEAFPFEYWPNATFTTPDWSLNER